MINGFILAIIEVSIVFNLGYILKSRIKYVGLNNITYYWLFFTFITGIWEFSFLINYESTCNIANNLLENNQHVWRNQYKLIEIIPWKFAQLFYAEYGAYADREYMIVHNNWSRIIEGTHLIFCGLGSALALLTYNKKKSISDLFISSSMSAQAMNSILYIVNYFHETRDPLNPNYNSTSFPTGIILNDRPFMYINILWTIMPLYILFKLFTQKEKPPPYNDIYYNNENPDKVFYSDDE